MTETDSAVLQAPMSEAPRRCHTLLVVDDEADVVRSVRDLFRLDYHVLTTTSVDEAIRLMEQEEVHVVMTDQRMPGMTGVEFLAHVKGDYPDAIRLLFTGYADLRAVIDAINRGNVFRYITKPWDPDELQTIIREAMERYDLIVERKKLTADLQITNHQLKEANQELADANRMKEAFIQVASHELRTPIAILEGLLSLMEQDPAHISTDLRVRLHKTSDRLRCLVEQLTT
ncbi:MAG: response regulator, partial [Phycisphaerae bacterium]